MRCPCRRCGCRKWQTRVVRDHLICTKFTLGCTIWSWHGLLVIGDTNDTSNVSQDISVSQCALPSQDLMQDMVHDALVGIMGLKHMSL